MNLDNFLVRPHRRAVERFSAADAWSTLTTDDTEEALSLSGLPSASRDDDEEAKRFDLLILRRQLAQLDGDAVAAERLRETVQAIASALLGKTAIPSVAEQAVLLEAVAGDEWWIDVTLPMLELARLRLRALVKFVERSTRNPVYTDFVDEVSDRVEINLPGITPGTNPERFRAKAAAYLREHEDHLALQRLRRNLQLTHDDLTSLEDMLATSGAGGQADIAWAAEQTGGLGLFIRSLVGLDRHAATEAFAAYLDGTQFTVDQVRFVNLIVDELTANGVMEPARLFESPYTDHAPTGPDHVFDDADVDVIVETSGHQAARDPAAEASRVEPKEVVGPVSFRRWVRRRRGCARFRPVVASADQVVLLQLGVDWAAVADMLSDPDARGPSGPPDGDSFFRVTSASTRPASIRSPMHRRAGHLAKSCVGLDPCGEEIGRLRHSRTCRPFTGCITLSTSMKRSGISRHGWPPCEGLLAQTTVLGNRTANELLHVLRDRSLQRLSMPLRSSKIGYRTVGPSETLTQATAELHDAVTLGLRLAGLPSGVLLVGNQTPGTTPQTTSPASPPSGTGPVRGSDDPPRRV